MSDRLLRLQASSLWRSSYQSSGSWLNRQPFQVAYLTAGSI